MRNMLAGACPVTASANRVHWASREKEGVSKLFAAYSEAMRS
jgi:hypothetical protein